jgi:hypothetical protein
MQRLTGIMLVAAVSAATLAGCALRDPRSDYAYSRASDGLWGDTAFELIDWNFPTSLNQPPIEAPKRIRLERTAIGVTWATRNPLPLADNLAPYDAPPASVVISDDGKATSNASAAPRASAGAATADRERRGVR